MTDILAVDEGEGLAAEFESAANDPDGFDFGFEEARKETGYANFGFDPAKAAELRDAENARIAALYPDDEDEDDEDWDDEDNDDSSLEY